MKPDGIVHTVDTQLAEVFETMLEADTAEVRSKGNLKGKGDQGQYSRSELSSQRSNGKVVKSMFVKDGRCEEYEEEDLCIYMENPRGLETSFCRCCKVALAFWLFQNLVVGKPEWPSKW